MGMAQCVIASSSGLSAQQTCGKTPKSDSDLKATLEFDECWKKRKCMTLCGAGAGICGALPGSERVAGVHHAAAAHAPGAAALQRHRVGLAARRPLHRRQILWAPGRRVPPHCRHPCSPPPLLHPAPLPCAGAYPSLTSYIGHLILATLSCCQLEWSACGHWSTYFQVSTPRPTVHLLLFQAPGPCFAA